MAAAGIEKPSLIALTRADEADETEAATIVRDIASGGEFPPMVEDDTIAYFVRSNF